MKAQEAALPVLKVTLSGSIGDEYKQGSMQLTDTEGNVVELPAKFKVRGATARSYTMKPSFNMKLREADGTEVDSCLLGLRSCSSWILDAMAIDRVCMRNRVCFDLWNEMYQLPYDTQFNGRCGTVGRFVEVYINDAYKGIYCLTDRINRKLLDLKKVAIDETTGEATVRGVLYKHGKTIYEGTDEDGNPWHGSTNEEGYFNDYSIYVIAWHDLWSLEEPEDYASPEVWDPLREAYATYDDYGKICDKFYVENLASLQILTMALAIKDNWGKKNHYLSVRNIQADGNKARMVFEPWDLDTSLGGEYDGSVYGEAMFDSSNQWPVKSAVNNAFGPFSKCCGTDEYIQLLRNTWIMASKDVLSVDNVKSKLQGYCDLFLNSGAWKRYTDYWNTKSNRPMYLDDLATEVDNIGRWYELRFQEMDDYFGVTDADRESATGITTVSDECHTGVYDLMGRKTTAPGKGVYIKDGKKFVSN